MTDINSDREVLAATLFGEARGETLAGKRAVAVVVMNRVKQSAGRPQFGDGTVRGACLHPYQFSCWNEGGDESQRSMLLALYFQDPRLNADSLLATCLSVADAAIAGKLIDQVHGATFYKVSTLPWPKTWGEEKPPVCVIGHHSFYKGL